MHEALDALGKAIAAAPENAALHLSRGDLHRRHGDWAVAEKDFAQAEKLDPALFGVDLARGQMLADAGRDAGAKAALDRFIARHPGSAPGYLARARR